MTTAARTTLPAGLAAYRRTPVFDQDTLPRGLRHRHSTRPGVWAVIHVVEGSLRFRLLAPPSETIVAPETPQLVAPEQPHEAEPDGPVRFFIEFYR